MRSPLARSGSVWLVAAGILWASVPAFAQSLNIVNLADVPYAQLVRTADVSMRGLTAADFPRVKKLAENIYGYEELANPIGSNGAFTTNSLIVVTREGVVVAAARGRRTKPEDRR